jgi:hypothetical protein
MNLHKLGFSFQQSTSSRCYRTCLVRQALNLAAAQAACSGILL